MNIKIDYRDYPEFMFAIICAYLPELEGRDLRRVAGDVVFRHTDKFGNTYKNGVLHSYDDRPALVQGDIEKWYKDGELHRYGDLPAVNKRDKIFEWWVNGRLHREADEPAVIDKNGEEWRWPCNNSTKYIINYNNMYSSESDDSSDSDSDY